MIKDLKANGIKVAVISSSKNSPYILKNIGLINEIETEINGNDITKGKPDPQIFLMAAERLGFNPDVCVVFEDAVLGVEAAKRAKMICVGVDRHDDPEALKKADLLVKDLGEVNYQKLAGLFKK